MKYLQKIWITNEKGRFLVQFHKRDNTLSNELVDTYIDALKKVAENKAQNDMVGFESQDEVFFYHQKQAINFFATTQKSEDRRKAAEELKMIATNFTQMFPEESMKTWKGDIDMFLRFYDHIAHLK